MGRHKPVPGGLAAAVRAADTHENNTADSLPLSASSYVTFRIKAGAPVVFLEDRHPTFPYIALLVSGGTSSIFLCTDFNSFELLGRTRDDAAGEAFDKVAKILHLGYPGGRLLPVKHNTVMGQDFRFHGPGLRKIPLTSALADSKPPF